MQNKIYTILASLYSELKAFKGDKGSLDNAVKKLIDEHPEVVDARGGYNELGDRLKDIQEKLSNSNVDSSSILSRVENIKLDLEGRIPEKTTTVLSSEDKDILVSLDDRVSYKEDIISLLPNGSTILPGSSNRMISKAYMSSNDSVAAIKTVTFDEESKIKYDDSKNLLISSCVVPRKNSELYELPLKSANMFHSEEVDACIVPSMCRVVSDYSSPFKNNDGSDNYSNHMINILYGINEWIVNRSYLTIDLAFVEAVELSKVMLDVTSNSSLIKGSLCSSIDGVDWNPVCSFCESFENSLQSIAKAKYIKIAIDVYDGIPNRIITLKNLRIFTTNYNCTSGYVSTVEPIVLDYKNTFINIKLSDLNTPSKYITSKYALLNAIDDSVLYSYIPNTYNILPEDFRDSKMKKWVYDDLKNNMKINVNLKTLFTPDKVNGLTSIQGTLGACSITKEMTWSESNGWKPKTNVVYVVYVISNGKKYKIPLSIDNINKDIVADIGGKKLNFKINIIANNAIVVHVNCIENNNLIIDSIMVDVMSAYDFVYNNKPSWRDGSNYPSGYNNNVCYTSISNTSCSISPALDPICIYTVNSSYRISNVSYWYSGGFFYYYNTRVTAESSYNLVENGSSVAIIPNEIAKGVEVVSTTIEQPMYKTTIERRGCALPVSIFLGCDSADALKATINSVSNITTLNQDPIFSFEQEYVAKTFISKANISSIIAQQICPNSEDIQYSISFDGYKYYVLNDKSLKWLSYFNKGMSADTMSLLNGSIIDTIRCGSEWLYIKVRILNPIASIKNITISFEKDMFVLINKTDLLEKGMSKRVLESINADTLNSNILHSSPALLIASIAKSEYPSYAYKMSGFNIYDYKDIKWQEIDNTRVKEYLLGNNTLLYKNDTQQVVNLKIIRNLIKNSTALVDVRAETKELVGEIKEEQGKTNATIDILNQNIKLMYDTFKNSGTMPSELPSAILPALKEYHIPSLAPDGFYKIANVESFRGIQLWEEQKSFIGYSEKLIYNRGTKNQYQTSIVSVDDDGATISRDFDRDNPYICPETLTMKNSTEGYTPMYDISISDATWYGSVNSILENGGDWNSGFRYDGGFTWGGTKYSKVNGCNAIWNLPGEKNRYVDIILDFREIVYINYINSLYFGEWNESGGDTQTICSYQITTFSCSIDGKEYLDISKYNGSIRNGTVHFNKELRFIRIRVEVPYSYNKGRGIVTFTEMDIYFSPTRVIHNTEAYIYNSKVIDTANWGNFNRIVVDRYIDHNPCEMKFLLSDDPQHSKWKSWDGSKWCEFDKISLSNSMSIETLLSLNSTQLNKLTKGSLFLCAVMNTTDTYKTPILRSVEFLHDQYDTEIYYTSIDPYSLDLRYSNDKKEIMIKNTSSGNKKLKVILL